jgi:hypothetical protein
MVVSHSALRPINVQSAKEIATAMGIVRQDCFVYNVLRQVRQYQDAKEAEVVTYLGLTTATRRRQAVCIMVVSHTALRPRSVKRALEIATAIMIVRQD